MMNNNFIVLININYVLNIISITYIYIFPEFEIVKESNEDTFILSIENYTGKSLHLNHVNKSIMRPKT